MTILDTCCFCAIGIDIREPELPRLWNLLYLPGILTSHNSGILNLGGSLFIWATCLNHHEDLTSEGKPMTRAEVEVAMVMFS